jgi:steroid 5-alpha reductase family enzyme
VDLGTLTDVTLGAAVGVFVLLWLVSLPLKDSSIVDSAWGPTAALIALLSALLGEGFAPRRYLVLALVAVWGLRLGLYIFTRNRGHGEDRRYVRMREQRGPSWWWVSLFQVFIVQALGLWVVTLPVQVVAVAEDPDSFTILDGLGAAMWLTGFLFEAVGDMQLRRFKADPANAGRVMDTGLWRYTRHPNYFGDATMWWGIGLIGVQAPWGWAALIGPLMMTFILMRVTGVAMLERDLAKRKPGYAEYMRRTNSFVPGPPKERVPR